MPIYQYACRSCGHSLEALQKINDLPLQECPECGKPELAKQLTAAAFKLKGTGWYETDFKDSGKKKEAGDSAKESTEKKSADSKTNASASSSEGGKSSDSAASASGN